MKRLIMFFFLGVVTEDREAKMLSYKSVEQLEALSRKYLKSSVWILIIVYNITQYVRGNII